MKKEHPYNPLDKRNLGESVAESLLRRPIEKLPPSEPFEGAGIYAIYYFGDFPPYRKLAALNRNEAYALPIYVGKAIPAGARKGGFGFDSSAGTVLYRRLHEHARSIQDARNLEVSDFACRVLIVDDIWIPLGESLLIEMFSPLWNRVVDGFGIHDPGSGRYSQQRSAWDVIHPGRRFAEKCVSNKRPEDQILREIEEHLV